MTPSNKLLHSYLLQLEYGDWSKVEGEEEECGEERAARKTAMAREALLKFGPMNFTQMTLEHDQKYVDLY